jgi:hypothetical protein
MIRVPNKMIDTTLIERVQTSDCAGGLTRV